LIATDEAKRLAFTCEVEVVAPTRSPAANVRLGGAEQPLASMRAGRLHEPFERPRASGETHAMHHLFVATALRAMKSLCAS